MDIKKVYRNIEQPFATIAKWVTYIFALITVIGWILNIFELGKSGIFTVIADNLQPIWLFTLTLATFVLWIWTSALQRRFVLGFRDNFKGNLQDNWDFVGPWRLAESGTLQVTGSDEGGITKIGAQWENYTFTFKAQIVNDCLGVIVRAQDLYNYYMFQIWPDKIRPHRRAAVPVITEAKKASAREEHEVRPRPLGFVVGWQTDDINTEFKPISINPNLEGWFDVKVVVRGQSVQIYINDRLIISRQSFLQIATGKVGFRNFGSEEALVKDVRVTLQAI